MNTFKVTFGNGDHLITGMNATLKEAEDYYIGNWFSLYGEERDQVEAVEVDQLNSDGTIQTELSMSEKGIEDAITFYLQSVRGFKAKSFDFSYDAPHGPLDKGTGVSVRVKVDSIE
jgi:hypothetical protein